MMGLVTLGAGYWYWQGGWASWQTLLFTVLTLSQMANVLAVRSARQSLFRVGLLTNRALLGAVALTLLLQLLVVYLPVMQELFGTVPLGGWDLCLALVLSAAVLWVDEAVKWLARGRAGRQPSG
jgi:Ca2+-transporting ATPase